MRDEHADYEARLVFCGTECAAQFSSRRLRTLIVRQETFDQRREHTREENERLEKYLESPDTPEDLGNSIRELCFEGKVSDEIQHEFDREMMAAEVRGLTGRYPGSRHDSLSCETCGKWALPGDEDRTIELHRDGVWLLFSCEECQRQFPECSLPNLAKKQRETAAGFGRWQTQLS
jgi:hypothetical protein